MKTQITQKAIKENYSEIIKIGYADLSFLLSVNSPNYYTCGVYGWNADIYIIGGVVIVTGYRTFGNIKPAYNIVKKYEQKAKKIRYSNIDRKKQDIKITKLLNKFIEEVTHGQNLYK